MEKGGARVIEKGGRAKWYTKEKKRKKEGATDITPIVDIPKRPRLRIAVGRDARVVEAHDGDPRLQVRLVRHAADVDNHRCGTGGGRER